MYSQKKLKLKRSRTNFSELN